MLASLGEMARFFNQAKFHNSPTLEQGSSPAVDCSSSPIRGLPAFLGVPVTGDIMTKSLKQTCLFSFSAQFHLLINCPHTYLVPSRLMPHYEWNEIGFLSCIMWKKTDTTYVISKSQGPIGIQAVLYCSSCLPLSSEKNQSSFPPKQTLWSIPKPSYTTWVLPQALVSPGDSFRCNRENPAVPHYEEKVLTHSPAMSLFPSFLL